MIQVATHYFIDTAVLELFATAKVFSWLFSMNCVQIYNIMLRNVDAYILNNWLAFSSMCDKDVLNGFFIYLLLLDKDVLNGFFIYLLLLDKAERQTQLILSHDSQRQAQIDVALIPQNKEMEGVGQEAYPHACDKCFVVVEDSSGSKINNCNTQCAPGHHTCDALEHRQLELAYYKPAKALFQLWARLKKAGVLLPADSVLENEDGEMAEEVIEGEGRLEGGNGGGEKVGEVTECEGKSEEGNQAVSAVNNFAKAVFPTKASTPEYFVFDNNFKLCAHQETIQDTHFSNTGFPVDVFHFNSKHKETDTYCQLHFNPAAFPDLVENGKWCFNTSIYEMIKRRNHYVISELHRGGHNPWSIPIASLSG
ncbi:hypothetical protein HYDPIDRAFT_164613 [Hydnomerulius pinastri MD-312]|nr:hypothetical protein HYDPIDRAFT_164613 [Hydnomerulius pinastri MD-312]